MPYNTSIARTDVAAGITEEVGDDFLGYVAEQSAAMSLFRRIPVGGKQKRFPVLSALPIAYFVNGDTGLKQTTTASWQSKYMDIEEIAVILPVPDAVRDDSGFDIYGEARPLLTEAIAYCLDAAIFFGLNKPTSWPTDIAAAAIAAGNTVTAGTAAATSGGIAGDLGALMGKVEEDGFDVNGFLLPTRYKGKFRAARDTTGQKLQDISTTMFEGQPFHYGLKGLWPATGAGVAEAFALDGSEFVLGIRKDIDFKIADQAVLQDNTGAIVFNLFQQDATALRMTFRVGWQVANTIRRDNTNAATRYPAGVLVGA